MHPNNNPSRRHHHGWSTSFSPSWIKLMIGLQLLIVALLVIEQQTQQQSLSSTAENALFSLGLSTSSTKQSSSSQSVNQDDQPSACACDSTAFQNVTTPLFVVWEDFNTKATASSTSSKASLTPPLNWFIVQLGGNIGWNVGGGDPVWEYVRPCHWRGVILEPQPSMYAQLRQNYADVSHRITTLNWAVSNVSGPGRMAGTGEMASLRIAAPQPPQQPPNPNTNQPDSIRVVTLQELWNLHVIPKQQHAASTTIDALIVDVEGHEEAVLAGQLLPHPKPRFVLFEFIHLTLPARQRIHEALTAQHYQHVADLQHNDAFARRNNAPAQDRLYRLLQQ